MNRFLFLLTVFGLLFSSSALAGLSSCIDINTASKEELEMIVGIGPVIAQGIMDKRPFSSLGELIKVSRIGEITLQKIMEQGLACVSSSEMQTQKKEELPRTMSIQDPREIESKITLSFLEKNPVNKEIEVKVFISGLKNSFYDVKISIEKEKTISNIYDEKEDKWQSSRYYINNLFSGTSFEKTFKLKIKEDSLNFEGKADILVRIRENGKSSYLEQREKINLDKPVHQEEEATESKGLTRKKSLGAIKEHFSDLSVFSQPFLFAFSLALFSGSLILTIKRKLVK